VRLSRSLHHAESLEGGGGALLVLLDVGRVFRPVLVHVEPAALLQDLLPAIGLDELGEDLVEGLQLLLAQALVGRDAAPVGEHERDALFRQRRGIDALEPRRRADGDHLQLTGLDLLGEVAIAAGTDVHLAAEHGDDDVAGVLVRHEVHLLGVEAGEPQDVGHEDMVGGGRRAAGPGHRAGVRLVGGEQVLHRVVLRVLPGDDDLPLAGEQRQRLHVVHGDGRLVRDREQHVAGALRQDRVAVALLRRNELREGDHAAAAGDVDDLRVLDDAFLLQRLGDGAGHLVLAAARAAGGDHLEPVHGEGRRRRQRERGDCAEHR
jgi:hypothetical protein